MFAGLKIINLALGFAVPGLSFFRFELAVPGQW